jgi:hypothetical protein
MPLAEYGKFQYSDVEWAGASTKTIQREARLEGDGYLDASAELSDVFPSQSTADLDFTLVSEPVLGFASEWVYEDSNFDNPEAFTFVLDIRRENPFTARLQFDRSGDGNPDYTAGPVEISRKNQTVSFSELGDDGWYRLIISDMRPNTFLRAVTWGPTRY